MYHTFLLAPGRWRVQGIYTDVTGSSFEAEGETTISHEGDVWLDEAVMRVKAAQPIVFESLYRVRPLAPGDFGTHWESESPALGALQGTFAFIEDTILSVFRSRDGQFQGSEYLTQRSTGEYLSKGCLTREGELLSTWSVALTRQAA